MLHQILDVFKYLVLPTVLIAAAACSGAEGETAREADAFDITLTSPAFQQGEAIPVKYTCDGEDISPPLQWVNLPAGAANLALVMDDPDAPNRTWVHWVMFDLPSGTAGLPEGASPAAGQPGGGIQGANSWNRNSYGGPCPPSGTHRYFFTLYALDTPLGLSADADKEEVLSAMEGHILGQGQLMGTYKRQ